MDEIARKIYLSYHHDDQAEVDAFLEQFDHLNNMVVQRSNGGLGEDIEREDDKHKVIHMIRDRYLKDSTVTLVLLGKCTYTRRSVDLELLASLHHSDDDMADTSESVMPNGLLGVMLPSYEQNGFPDRLNENLQVDEGQSEPYARVIPYPQDKEILAREIEEAHVRRGELRPDNTPTMQLEDKACL